MMILNIETAGHWLVVAKGGKISWSLKCVPFILTMSFVDRVDEIIRQNEHSTKNFFFWIIKVQPVWPLYLLLKTLIFISLLFIVIVSLCKHKIKYEYTFYFLFHIKSYGIDLKITVWTWESEGLKMGDTKVWCKSQL